MFRFANLAMLWLIVPIACGLLWSTRPAGADERADIEAVLTRQAAAWNRGDIDEFMEHYWKSDELTFSSGGQITRGWTRTKENYQRRYPTREQMGQLKFTQLEITPLGQSAALVLGRWQLARDSSPVGGNFTLIFRRLGDRWVIVHDHTSKADAP
jgi:L-asparaginase / beta-aspartyl-peptidase